MYLLLYVRIFMHTLLLYTLKNSTNKLDNQIGLPSQLNQQSNHAINFDYSDSYPNVT